MDLGTTNVWLATIAIVSVLQFAMIAAIGIFMWRQVARATAAFDELSRAAQPVITRTTAVLDDMRDLAERARKAEASAEAAVDRVAATWTHAKDVARARVWPVIGLVRGFRAAAAALKKPRTGIDQDAESRFVYEGGTHATDVRN